MHLKSLVVKKKKKKKCNCEENSSDILSVISAQLTVIAASGTHNTVHTETQIEM